VFVIISVFDSEVVSALVVTALLVILALVFITGIELHAVKNSTINTNKTMRKRDFPSSIVNFIPLNKLIIQILYMSLLPVRFHPGPAI